VSQATSIAGLVAATLVAAPASGEDPAPPAAHDPPKPRPPEAKPPKPGEALPEPEIRLWMIAPSIHGPWALRIDNEGSRWLRVPADLRPLQFTIEPGDTVKRGARPVTCALPRAMRPDGFPDKSALLLGPGESFFESFDPRLFCFGKDAATLAGGAVVRTRF